jgi:hypothetical protein
MQLPARRREPLNVRGDVRETLVHDTGIHRAVRAAEVAVAEHQGARRLPPGRRRSTRRTAVGRIRADRRLGPVARVQG